MDAKLSSMKTIIQLMRFINKKFFGFSCVDYVFFPSLFRPINMKGMCRKSNDITLYLNNFMTRMKVLKHTKNDCCTFNRRLLNIKTMLNIQFYQRAFMIHYGIRFGDHENWLRFVIKYDQIHMNVATKKIEKINEKREKF